MQTTRQKIRLIGLILILIMVPFCCQIYAASAAPELNTDKKSYNSGEKINVNFSNATGNEGDWICIVPVGSPDTEAGDYKYMPKGLRQGVLTFDCPAPGKYEVRAYYNYSRNGYVVSARQGFFVKGGVPSDKSEKLSPPKEVKTGVPAGKSEKSSPVKEVDINFIPAERLSTENLNKLWWVAKNKCGDFGWSVANDDKKTRNLICQTQSSGSIRIIRVRFADEGVYVNLQILTPGWALFKGKDMASKSNQHREMKKALQDSLAVMGYAIPKLSGNVATTDESTTAIPGWTTTCGTWQVTLFKVQQRNLLACPGHYTTPTPGYTFLVIEASLRNLDPTQRTEIKNADLMVVDSVGKCYTNFGSSFDMLYGLGDSYTYGNDDRSDTIKRKFVFVVNIDNIQQPYQFKIKDQPCTTLSVR